jgi:hypothetical protein
MEAHVMKRGRLRGRVAARITAALVLVGLAGGCAQDGVKPGPGEPTVSAAGDEVILPIDAYAFTLPEVEQVSRARQRLVVDCMLRFGFELTIDLAQSDRRAENRVKDFGRYGNKRRYGITNPQFAAQYGYHLPSVVDGTAVTPGPESKQDGSAAEELVLSGKAPAGGQPGAVNGKTVPPGGCLGEADSKISPSGGAIQDPELVTQISSDSYNRSLTDPQLGVAFAAWTDCMRGKGYNYPSPQEAGGDFSTDAKVVPPKELATAVADVACKQQTKLVDAWFAFEAKYQQGQLNQHAETLGTIKANRDAQLKRVADILATKP